MFNFFLLCYKHQKRLPTLYSQIYFSAFFQLPRHVYLRHLSTHDTRLQHWGYGQFTVMESGLVVLFGKSSEQTPAAFHLYLKDESRGWKKLAEVRALCEHEECARLHPVHIEKKELLAVSCSRCHMIRLLDTESEGVTVAFLHGKCNPGSMSKGDGTALYALHLVNNQPTSVIELESRAVPFKGPKKKIYSGLATSYSVCYIPHPYKLLVFTFNKNPGIIRAVSTETGQKVWQIEGKVDEKECHPHGMQFSQHHQVLLVADGINCRILVLHPKNGSHLQTIQLKPEMYAIVHLHLNQDKLIVHHAAERKEKVSFFAVC